MQYVYIDDVVKYTFEALSLPAGIYNLGGDEYMSMANTADMVAEFFGATVCFLRDRKEGEALPFMDTTKLRESSLGDHLTPFAVALREYCRDLGSQSR